ncbi:uncharacterized protein LOC129773188 [Toxorhynchites rutilus septentrionalis]|uniref:uncharacterized protein LOC129773188 n=1 Tax=Toxorhynchites rutilus septentrionalis TaxID=329112 RepID=UPI0024788819|nr:uncharacterized protein LOC129773188 [Toxorhynchites rutilus septentrionalis]
MKVFIVLFVITLAAAAASGSYVPTAWPTTTLGWNSWNGLNKWSTWNDHNGIIDTSYVNSWPSAWSAASLNKGWNGWYAPKTTVVQANIAKVNPWGLPWSGYGHGYNDYLGNALVSKYVTPNTGSILVAPLGGHNLNQKLIVA